MQNFRRSVVKLDQPTYPITFNRSKKKMKEISRIYKNASSRLERFPVVYFVTDSGDDEIEEDAADVGGPQREFFAIVMETLLSSNDPQLFEGDDGHKLPVHSQQLVLRGWFSLAGQAMAHVIAHTDFVTVGLAKPIATYLETGCTETACATVTMDDIPDLEIKEMLENLMNVDGKEVDVNDALSTLMSQCGVTAALVTRNNAAEVAYECMIYQVVHKRLAELEQLREGLGVLGLVKLMESHPRVGSEIFKTIDEAAVSFDVLKRRVQMDAIDDYDATKQQTFHFFLNYLKDTCERESGM